MVMNFTISIFLKILSIMQLVHCRKVEVLLQEIWSSVISLRIFSVHGISIMLDFAETTTAHELLLYRKSISNPGMGDYQ